MRNEGLYRGEVVHARLRPVAHKLSYKVFSLLTDIDRLDELGRRLKLFSYNRFGLTSVCDKDHFEGKPLRQSLDSIAAKAGMAHLVDRYLMLAYPRILGFVFNPITVFYGLDKAGTPRLMIYEVNNTFGQKQTYVLPVEETKTDGLIHQACAKTFYVSPFNNVEGDYAFHITPPSEEMTIGVALKTDGEPLLRAHFRGRHEPVTDTGLLKALLAYGWMSINVVVAIHFEALKLWLKGLRLRPRPKAPKSRIELPVLPRISHDSPR